MAVPAIQRGVAVADLLRDVAGASSAWTRQRAAMNDNEARRVSGPRTPQHCAQPLFDKGTIIASWYVDAIGRQAILSRRGPLCGHRALDGLIEIDVVKDDKGGMPSQLERRLLYSLRGSLQ